MACLGMFVSCSDDPQEVVVSYDYGSTLGYAYTYYGTASGTVVSTDSDTYTISDRFATISYADKETEEYGNAEIISNAKNYKMKFDVKSSSNYFNSVEITLRKIGNDYYNQYDDKKLTLTGSPEDKEFTIASIETYNCKFTNLKFTRK